MDMEKEAILFRKWKSVIEQRFYALEQRASPALAPVSDGVDLNRVEKALEELKATVVALQARTDELAALLATVEKALEAQPNPPLGPISSQPASSTASPGA